MKASQCPQETLATCGDRPHSTLKLPTCICTPPVRSGSDGPGPSPFPTHPLTHWVGGQLRPSLYFPSHRRAPRAPSAPSCSASAPTAVCMANPDPAAARPQPPLTLLGPGPRQGFCSCGETVTPLPRHKWAWWRRLPWREVAEGKIGGSRDPHSHTQVVLVIGPEPRASLDVTMFTFGL